jgi:hypothetical protein
LDDFDRRIDDMTDPQRFRELYQALEVGERYSHSHRRRAVIIKAAGFVTPKSEAYLNA